MIAGPTHGHWLLERWVSADPATRTNAHISRLVGVSRVAVSYWRRDYMRPGAEARFAIEDAIGIPARAWERAQKFHASKQA